MGKDKGIIQTFKGIQILFLYAQKYKMICVLHGNAGESLR